MNASRSSSLPSGGLVYSTDSGRMCPQCRQPMAQCVCNAAPVVSTSADGIVRVSRETKGRAGKGVTLVKGLGLEGEALTALAKALKATCGSGGTVKDGVGRGAGRPLRQGRRLPGRQGLEGQARRGLTGSVGGSKR